MYLLPYLSMGWTVVNVEYRIARNSLAPAAVEDCRCSLRWIVYHAKEYNIDTSKIVLTGTSAGGHLSLIAGMLPAGNPFDRQCPTDSNTKWNSGTEPEIKVAAIVNFFGITDVAELLDGPNAKHYAMEWLGSRADRVELAKQLSPVNYAKAGGPPVITIHGENDNVAPYSAAVRLHDALQKAGVKNQLITIKGRGHGGFSREEMVSSYAAVRGISAGGGRNFEMMIRTLCVTSFLGFALLCSFTAFGISAVAQTSIPHLRKTGTATQLIVGNKPFLIRGGELGNSTASSSESMAQVWEKLVRLNLKPSWSRSTGN
jgi:dienelactone hydrolase